MRILQNKSLDDPEKSDGLKDLKYHQDRGLELILHKEKNNQGGTFFRNKHGKSGS
ncbi:15875_t:CDS:2 [Funneliformis caledonium]|uniref:15875_t:CDS:1 n=1 Tax=Funneliformis caledonium TaxID=1117310 RepID=A0A9N9H1P3_9GLOM|nr:15875_t:CDS:2 [Funneliformis caledonium]